MNETINKIVLLNKEISIMDNITNGRISSVFDDVLKFYTIPCKKEFFVKFGIKETTISEYGLSSVEVSREMARCISIFSNSDYGIGITGNISKEQIIDPIDGEEEVFISIFKKETNQIYVSNLKLVNATYEDKFKDIISSVINVLNQII